MLPVFHHHASYISPSCVGFPYPNPPFLNPPPPTHTKVNYINAHATSTLVGDIAEVKAIKKVFTDMSHVKMNATKSAIGHCLGAAGGLEAVAVIKAIETGWLHPTLNLVWYGWVLCGNLFVIFIIFLCGDSVL